MRHSLEFAHSISVQDLRVLGINEVAYIKPQELDGQEFYTIHAADGTEMARVLKREIAIVTVRQNDMEPVSLH